MNKLKNFFNKLWNDESAQGATEYILLLVVVVGLGIMFKGRITKMLDTKMGDLEGKVGDFNVE
jgi:Flp pilus assembly pilin Flp